MMIQDTEFRITHHFSDGLYAKESSNYQSYITVYMWKRTL